MNFLLRLLLPIFLPESKWSWIAFGRSLVTILIVAFSLEAQIQPQEVVQVRSGMNLREGIFLSWAGVTAILTGAGITAAGFALYIKYAIKIALEEQINSLERWIDDRFVRKDVLNSKMDIVKEKLTNLESRTNRISQDVKKLRNDH